MNKKFLPAFISSFVLACAISFAQTANTWKVTGPTLFPSNISGQINGIGRICQLKFHPTNPEKMYAVSASGGLWISNDNSAIWQTTGTDNLPHTACASVCIDYTNDSILYLGTGDPNYYSASFGIWKSTDAGKTWSMSNTNISTRMALEIVMDPADHNILIAATNDGIWKSYDAGTTWQEKQGDGRFTDMVFNPKLGSRIIYAVTFSEIYRSTDMGETWQRMTSGFNLTNGGGLRLAVSAARPEVVYVGAIAGEGTIFKSVDSGLTFVNVRNKPSESIVGYEANQSGQGNYNFSMTADPNNADIVYVAAHCVWRSDDGGVNFKQLTKWYVVLHTDMHHITFSPHYTSRLFNANDGGVWLSTDAGKGWKPVSDNLAATECYHGAQSPTRNDMVSIGTQDNGGLCYIDNAWKTNRGGDWFSRETFDYSGENKVYYLSTGLRRNMNAGGNSSESSFNIPFTPSDNSSNQTLMEFTPIQPELAFISFRDVYRTLNLSAKPSWKKIASFKNTVKALALSPVDPNVLYIVAENKIHRTENALGDKPVFISGTPPASTLAAAGIAVLRNKPDVVYLSCGSKMFRSEDKGTTWTNITGTLPAINIIRVYHDPYSTDESVYIGTAKGVYYRNETMSDWMNYSTGLPTVADINDFMVFNDGTTESVLRVAYYGRGVWEVPLYNRTNTQLEAMFTSGKGTCTEVLVAFVNQSGGTPSSYQWYFEGGDPEVSTEMNPWVTYYKTGTYDVRLIVKNSKGESDTLEKKEYMKVEIAQKPVITREGSTLVSSQGSTYQWYLDGNDIQDATTRIYTPNEEGNYSVLVIDSNFCLAESDDYPYFLSGLGEKLNSKAIRVYPNPSKGEFNLSVGIPAGEGYNLEISNAIGQVVLREEVKSFDGVYSKNFSLGSYGTGVYTLKISGASSTISKDIIIF